MVARTRAVVALVIARVEYLITSPWLIGALALLAVSSATVVVTGARGLAEHQERYTLELQQRLRATLLADGPSGGQVDRALRVVRPPIEASLLVPGQVRSLPAAWDFGPGAVEALPPYPETSSPKPVGGATDGATLIGLFGGLFAFALGLTTVVRDRRRGWSDAERSTGAPAFVFVLSHLLSAGTVLGIVIGIWFGAISLAGHQIDDPGWRLANRTLWTLSPLTWLYALTLYGYGAAIGWHVHASLRAIVIAAMLWVSLALIGPQLMPVWSSWSSDLSSRARVERDQRDAYSERVRQLEDDLSQKVALRVGNTRLALEKETRATLAFQALEPDWSRGMADARAAADSLEHAWRAKVERIAVRSQWVARLTPTTLLPQVLAEVSGTGSLMTTEWQRAVGDYKQRLDLALFDNRPVVILRLPIDGSAQMFMATRHPVTPYKDLPQFVPPAAPADRWRASAPDVLALLLHAIAGLVIAGLAQRRAWRRYDFVSLSADVSRP